MQELQNKERIVFGEELRKAIKETTTIVTQAVKSTLGPMGTNVGTLSEIHLPVIVNDGVTVVKKKIFEDDLKQYIHNVLKTVSQNTERQVGDASTTSLTIAEAIIIGGLKYIDAGFSQVDIVKGINKATADVLKELEKRTISLKDNKDTLLHVATVSANNDKELGKIISDAFSRVGADGQIEIEDSTNDTTYVEFVDGMKYPCGSESNMFYNTDKSTTEFSDCKILIYEGRLTAITPLIKMFQEIRNENEAVLLICDDYGPNVVNDIANLKVQNNLRVCTVKSPNYGIAKDNDLSDIAEVTGASIISKRYGNDIEDFDMEMLGNATSVKVDQHSFTIVNTKSDKKATAKKIKQLKVDLKKAPNKTEKSEIEQRVARLSNGVAMMYVSGDSPIEIAEKKYRIEDAIHATRASLEEGTVPGGGVTLLKISNALKTPIMDNEAQVMGYKILIDALSAPIRTIAFNAGGRPDIVVDIVLSHLDFNYGYDARSRTYVDMVEKGILDPKKVTRIALMNASSVSQMLLTTNCIIY